MLKKVNRISTNFEFRIARKYGKKYVGSFFNAYALSPERYRGPIKLGVVVSNKVSRDAVKRNKIKRRYRDILRSRVHLLPGDTWIVLYVNKDNLGRKYEEIRTDVDSTLSKVFIA